MREASGADKDIVASCDKPPEARVGPDEAGGGNLQQSQIGNSGRLIPIGRLAASFVALRQLDQRSTVQVKPDNRDVSPLTELEGNARKLQDVGRRREAVVKVDQML